MSATHCVGSRAIAQQVTDQCDSAETAAKVLMFAAAIAGLHAGLHPGQMALEFSRLFPAAEALTGIQRRRPQ